MSTTSKTVNAFFKNATRKDVDGLTYSLLLTARQEQIFEMFYLQRHDINFIADTIGCCPRVVQKELRTIRKKLINYWLSEAP